MRQRVKVRTSVVVRDFDPKTGRKIGEKAFEDVNLILKVGAENLWKLAAALGGTPWDGTSRIGVGNSNAPASYEQTGLLGTQTAYKTVNSGYPQVRFEDRTCTWEATFLEAEANFDWNEAVILTSTGTALNRIVAPMGTKSAGTTRSITITCQLS